ncbi:hypothetical protein ACG2LH_14925 [Zhouia sp. PK063]|uniref:hypothetical protein n=1 Tax=Zhouia sp. PK063 TaxID=3373602 RepID=UPI0037A8325B
MKTILVPTDFTIDCLHLLKKVLHYEETKNLNVILTAGIHTTQNFSDLLFYKKHKHLKTLESKSYIEAKAILINRYQNNIRSVRTELFLGKNDEAFFNFLKGLRVDEAYLPTDENAMNIHFKEGFNIVPFIKKSVLPITDFTYELRREQQSTDSIAQLLVY